VARDRQRAKQRKARRAQNPGPARSEPYRADLPGELEHASGEVDEFDAALVAGAGGLPADAQSDADDAFVAEEEERQAGRQPFGDEDDDDLDAELEQAAVAAALLPPPPARLIPVRPRRAKPPRRVVTRRDPQ